MTPELMVDLRLAPEERWRLSRSQCEQARELLALYKADLGLPDEIGDFLVTSAREFIRADYWTEIEGLSQALGSPVGDVILCNLYYDALKVVLGCTAFAVESPNGVLHARNLDWSTRNAILSRYTLVSRFVGAPAGEFVTIGWPGFIGAFSGIAPGRFAVSLNAVLSLERAQPASPVVLLLRTVLEEARSFDEALTVLATTAIPSDCLLLLTGMRAGELAVIERTPSRHAIRRGRGAVFVTNDFLQIDVEQGASSSELLATSCGRLKRIEALVDQKRPASAEECFRYLGDVNVQMEITVQQMVFRALTGEYWLRLPDKGANA
jgi:acid ceramidase